MKTLFQSGFKQKRNEAPAAGRKTSRKFSVVQKILLLALVAQICAAGSLKAQWDHWGGNVTTSNIYNSPYTANPNRAHANYGSMTLGPISTYYGYQGTINYDHLHGSFSPGDKIMIVQMDGPVSTNRNYDLATILTTGSGTMTVQLAQSSTSASVTTALMPDHVDWTSTHIQIVGINCWYDMEIDAGATITGDAWDPTENSGGIIAFDVEGTLTLSGGTVDMSGKGYGGGTGTSGGTNQNGTSTPGTAGSSQLASGSNATGTGWSAGDYGIPGDYMTASSPCSSDNNGGNGGNGLKSKNGGAASVGNAVNLGVAGSITHAHMNLGFGGDAGVSGRGAGAGGSGGGGGAGYYYSGDGFTGNDPTDGIAGSAAASGHGGNGGDGGTGGGVIYIRVNNTPSGNATDFYTNGTNASSGTNAIGNGGAGGNGGNGGDGLCTGSGIFPAGGGGAGGKGGGGADGGNGGKGGNGGTIWVIYKSTLASPAFVNTETPGSGGGHGTGTSAGADGSYGSDGAHINTSACSACSPSYGYKTKKIVHYCDCDDAMRVLETMDTKSGSSIPVTYTLTSSSNYCYYDNTDGLQSHEFSTISAPTGTTPGIDDEDIYFCPYAPNCPFMTNILPPSGNAPGSGDYGWGSGPDYTSGWYPGSQSGTYNIDDAENNLTPECTATCWDPNGEDGNDGGTGDQGTYETTPDPGPPQGGGGGGGGGGVGATIDDPLGPVATGKKDDIVIPSLALSPNPVNDMLNVNYNTLNAQQDYTLNVIDIKGQIVITGKFSATVGQNTYQLSTSTLSPGTYTLQLISNGNILKGQFIKQ